MALAQLVRVLALKELRTRWRGLVLVGLVAVLWVTVTMSAVAGARRTASVVERFQRTTMASDATYSIAGDRDGGALFEAIMQRPEVATADVLWSASTGRLFDEGLWVTMLAGTEGRWGREFDLPVLVRGRLADPHSISEVVVTRGVSEVLDVDVGDRLQLPTWDHATLDAWFEVRGAFPPFDGPLLELDIVGVVEFASSLSATKEESLFVLVTPAFLDKWQSALGENGTTVIVAFDDPATDPSLLVSSLTSSVGFPVDVVSADQAYASHLHDSAKASTVGLIVLAAAVALVGGFVVALGIGREVRRAVANCEPLRALGATPQQRILVMATPIAVVGMSAAMCSVALSVWASRLFPVGPVRAAEPLPGTWADVPVLAGSALFVAFMLIVAAVCTLRRDRSWSRRAASIARPTAFVRSLGPAALVGHINAVGTRQARLTILAATVTIAGLCSTAWFTQSLHDLRDAESRWGYTWTSSPELNFAAELADERYSDLAEHPDVASVGFVESAVTGIAHTTVVISAFRPFRGEMTKPWLIAGRLPVGSREVALGERTARSLGVSIGDVVPVYSEFAAPVEWEVVGLVVPPYASASTETGSGAYTTIYNFDQLRFPFENTVRVLAVEYRDGVSWDAVESDVTNRLDFRFENRSHAHTPRSITDIVGASVVVLWLFVFFGLLGLLAILLTSARHGTRHGRELAILRTLGFTRRNVHRSLLAEAVTVTSIAAVFGVALGLIAGARVWGLTIGRLGVIDTQPSPLVVVAGVLGLAAIGTFISVAVSRVAVARGRWSRSLAS